MIPNNSDLVYYLQQCTPHYTWQPFPRTWDDCRIIRAHKTSCLSIKYPIILNTWKNEKKIQNWKRKNAQPITTSSQALDLQKFQKCPHRVFTTISGGKNRKLEIFLNNNNSRIQNIKLALASNQHVYETLKHPKTKENVDSWYESVKRHK